MSDERLEHEVRAALLRDDPGAPPRGLGARVTAIPDDLPGVRRAPRLSQLSAMATAVVAAIVVGVAAFAVGGVRDSTVGEASATPPAVTTTTLSLGAPVSGPWSGLRWSSPAAFLSPTGFDSLVTFDEQVFAIGQVHVGSATEVTVWVTRGGMAWNVLSQGGATFAGAGILTLLTTPTGLVAWGPDGEPACSAPGAGQVCGPVPQMVWTSQDGVTWTRAADLSALAGASIRDITGGPAGLVAAGSDRSGAPALWTSRTGARWSRLSLPVSLFAGAALSDVRSAATDYVLAGAVNATSPTSPSGPIAGHGGTAAAWWSADGRTWMRAAVTRQDGLGTTLGEIFVGARGLVAVGRASADSKMGTAWTSTDGRSWTPMASDYEAAPSPARGEATLPSFALFDDGVHLVATDLGPETMAWWSSSDGRTWHRLALSGGTGTAPVWSGDPVNADRWFDHAFVVPGGLVVVGTGSGSPAAPGRVWVATALP